jgi:hypothetical protein
VPLNVHECGNISYFVLLWRLEAEDNLGQVKDALCYNPTWDVIIYLLLLLLLSSSSL